MRAGRPELFESLQVGASPFKQWRKKSPAHERVARAAEVNAQKITSTQPRRDILWVTIKVISTQKMLHGELI